MIKVRIFTDGGSRGNPGPAGIGGVIQLEDPNIGGFATKKTISEYIGETTNNQAEYQALIRTLEEVKKIGGEQIECNLDSELIVKQLNHEYKVKDEVLAGLYMKVWNLASGFRSVIYKHVLREYNQEADALVNKAIDAAVGKK